MAANIAELRRHPFTYPTLKGGSRGSPFGPHTRLAKWRLHFAKKRSNMISHKHMALWVESKGLSGPKGFMATYLYSRTFGSGSITVIFSAPGMASAFVWNLSAIFRNLSSPGHLAFRFNTDFSHKAFLNKHMDRTVASTHFLPPIPLNPACPPAPKTQNRRNHFGMQAATVANTPDPDTSVLCSTSPWGKLRLKTNMPKVNTITMTNHMQSPLIITDLEHLMICATEKNNLFAS